MLCLKICCSVIFVQNFFLEIFQNFFPVILIPLLVQNVTVFVTHVQECRGIGYSSNWIMAKYAILREGCE